MAYQKIKYGGWKTGSNYNFEMAWDIHEIPTLKPMFSGSLNPVNLLSILPINDKYPEMEIDLLQTGSSYNYAAEGVICEIPTLKPTFSRSPNL